MSFPTTMSATVVVPEAGFTQDDLKAHLTKVKVPRDARIKPTIIQDLTDGDAVSKVVLVAEWLVE